MGKRRVWTVKEKLAILADAAASNANRAAKKAGADPALVSRWKKQEAQLRQANDVRRTAKRLMGAGRKPQSAIVDVKVFEWFEEQRARGFGVTPGMLKAKACAVAKAETVDNFGGSDGWLRRWKKRYDVSLRAKTSMCQKLPPAYMDKITCFQRTVVRLRVEHCVSDIALLANMDQTPMYFDMPDSNTLAKKGVREVRLVTCGAQKTRFTVALTALGHGGKIKPMCVFKGKHFIKGTKVPDGVVCRFHPRAWFDECIMLDWIKSVWKPEITKVDPDNRDRLLVLDAFSVHGMDSVKDALEACNTTIVSIPAGLTSILQPMDVSLNKPFKCAMRRRWADWMVNGEKTFTKSGNRKAPSRFQIMCWVRDCWEEMQEAMIAKSFKKCCIANELNGDEDGIPYDDEEEEEKAVAVDVSDESESGSSDEDAGGSDREDDGMDRKHSDASPAGGGAAAAAAAGAPGVTDEGKEKENALRAVLRHRIAEIQALEKRRREQQQRDAAEIAARA
jgi:hypothetical protein